MRELAVLLFTVAVAITLACLAETTEDRRDG